MTEDERASQLSAMFDGELPPVECELLARRLARDESLRRQWGSYALIGAALRGEPIVARGSPGSQGDVAARVRRELARSTDAVAPADAPDAGHGADAESATVGRRPRMPRWAVPLSGFGLAAGVAAAALLWLRTDTPVAATAAKMVPAVRPSAAAEVVVPMPLPASPPVAPVARGAAPGTTGRVDDSYTVPPPAEGGGLVGGATLANFLVAHSEVSMPMLRRNALSTLVAVPVDAEPVAVATEPAAGGAVERP